MNCPRRYTCWQSKRLYWDGTSRQKAAGQGNPGGLLCPVAHSLRFYGDGIHFQVVSGQSFWLRVLPGGPTLLSQDRFQWERFWEVGRTYGLALPLSFWPFLNYSSWSWLISSMFFTRTSCHTITHINGYCSAWPGWAVLVSGSPNSYIIEVLGGKR